MLFVSVDYNYMLYLMFPPPGVAASSNRDYFWIFLRTDYNSVTPPNRHLIRSASWSDGERVRSGMVLYRRIPYPSRICGAAQRIVIISVRFR